MRLPGPPLWSIGAALLAACHTLKLENDRPALIAEPTPASRAELEAVLERALGGRGPLLSDDTLTRSPILALEQGEGAPSAARGRVLALPERFELVLNEGRCFLIRTGTGQRFELSATECVPASP